MKKSIGLTLVKSAITASSAFFFGLSASVLAAPGELSRTPLYMGVGVPPNVLYVLDDSGSMSFEILKTSSSNSSATGYPTAAIGWQQVNGNWRYLWKYRDGGSYWNGSYSQWYDKIDVTPDTKEEALENCPGYSVLAFDPDVTYEPWTGTDANGNVFTNALFTTAYTDPYNSAGATDLSSLNPKYMVWNDADNDGEFDRGECGEVVGDEYNADPSSYPGLVSVSADLQANYANWYSYYRSRMNVLKGALSSILDESEEYVGLATINHDSTVRTPVVNLSDKNIDGTVNSSAASNREDMRQKTFLLQTSGGTPLKRAILNAGKYFEAGVNPNSAFLGSSPGEPIVESCQQNYMVLMTDGYYNQNISANVGNADADASSEFDGDTYADGLSDTMADIAMHYYERDLSPTLANEVESNNPADTNNAQHMVTYGVAFGVFGNLPGPPSTWSVGDTWPSSIADDSSETIDDLLHATYNGRGAFFSAANPQQLITHMRNVRTSIVNNAEGTAAAVGFNSTNVSAESLLFQAWFNTATWEGELRALKFEGSAVGGLAWEASEILESRDFSTSPRQIITYNGGAGIPFVSPPSYGSLSATTVNQAQVNDLLKNTPYAAAQSAENQTFINTVVSFLRGDTTVDGTVLGGYTFRDREGEILGDIIHSSPQYVAIPNAPYPNYIESPSKPYLDFVDDNRTRKPIVYVGSNDGMLHAFYAPPLTSSGSVPAGSGKEIFAYIPGFLFSDQDGRGLHELTENVYSHVPYVDSTPTISDVFINNEWRSYLVSGVGAGGKGIFVLDVTDPSVLEDAEVRASDIVVTEFTHANLGYTFARPQIAKLNNGDWAAIFGNGYNNNGSGEASLFVLYLDGHEGSGTLGPAYREISTGAGDVTVSCDSTGNNCNGLSAPSVIDYTNDAVADRVYAGDIQGNMWAFDLTSDDPDDWGVAHQAGANPAPLFIACRGTNATCDMADRQPITTKPLVVAHASQRALSTEPNLFVMFGTGQYLAKDDDTTTETQSFYGVWDAGDDHDRLRRANLQEQTYTTSNGTRSLSSNTVNYGVAAGNEYGWYMDFAGGERSVVTPLVAGDFVVFATTIPEDGNCTGGGSGYLMAAKMFDGSQPNFAVFGDIEEIIAGRALDNVPGGTVLIDNDVVLSDSKGNILDYEFKLTKESPSRRSSWSLIK